MASLSEIWSLDEVTATSSGGSNSGANNVLKVDVKSGTIAKLDLKMELYPGEDNGLLWRVSTLDTGATTSSSDSNLETLAITTLSHYLTTHANLFSIQPNELFYPNTVRSALHSHHNHQSSHLLQLSIPRYHSGIPVRDSRAFATIKNGNLISIGFNRWDTIPEEDLLGNSMIHPTIPMEEARRLLALWAEEDLVEEGLDRDMERKRGKEEQQWWDGVTSKKGKEEEEEEELEMELLDLCTPELQILVLDKVMFDEEDRKRSSSRHLKKNKSKQDKHKHRQKTNNKPPNNPAPTFQIGSGYTHALAWRICPKFTNQRQEIMEGLVDAHTGHIYSFIDTIDYFTGVAGVYPVSNDGQIPDGVMQSGYPMPFLSIRDTENGEIVTSDTGGNYWSVGEKTISLSGQYVHMEDQCGVSSLTVEGDFDWGGVSNGTDCDTPGFGGEGNTQASRSGYYELNRIIEIARSHLPGNGWLKKRLVANMNIPESCNAFWNGFTVNFYRSSGELVLFDELK